MASRPAPWVGVSIALLVVASLTAGCGGAGGGGGGSAAPGSTGAFHVVGTSPAAGSAAAGPSAVVGIDLSLPVDAASAAAHVTLVDDQGNVVAGTVSAAGSHVAFVPAQALALWTSYAITVDAALADASGHYTLGVPFAATFETRAEWDVSADLTAGAARVDITPPVGVPLGGFGEAPRRLSMPDLDPFNYYTLFAPSVGVLDPLYARALVLSDGTDKVAIVTLDGIATTDRMVQLAHQEATRLGASIPFENVLMCASHTHSGPGAISPGWFWQIVAMDLYVPSVEADVARGIGRAIYEADSQLAPAAVASGSSVLSGMTKNRRDGVSPYLTRADVDPELGVIRIDRPDGTPVATVWNYSIHGLGYWSDNMYFSADIMGNASAKVEASIGGVCLFANGAEGDINPEARGSVEVDHDGTVFADEIVRTRSSFQTRSRVEVESTAEVVDFGQATIDVSLSRAGAGNLTGMLANLSQLGISPGISFPLPADWTETRFRFQAIRIDDTVICSIPGEAIHEIGLDLKAYGRAAGFRWAYAFGLANGHMSYITTPREYALGGYEGIATFFGMYTGDRVVQSAELMIDRVTPR